MGINEMTLFPDLGGICRSLKIQYFSPDTIGLTPKEWDDLITKPRQSGLPYNALSPYAPSLVNEVLSNFEEDKEPVENVIARMMLK